MTTAIRRHSIIAVAMLAALASLRACDSRSASPLDDRGEMQLGLRAYTAVRIGTREDGRRRRTRSTSRARPRATSASTATSSSSSFDHDITRLAHDRLGAARIFGSGRLRSSPGWTDRSRSATRVQYRGEGEGIYDYGPSRVSATRATRCAATRSNVPIARPAAWPICSASCPRSTSATASTGSVASRRQRHRFFLAYIDFEKGPVFMRIGRQILAWGETDVFRLLDNINPLDDSFGGFFIALDERRLPIDMVRSSYRFGSFGPSPGRVPRRLRRDREQGRRPFPGIPHGSPWSPGGIGAPEPGHPRGRRTARHARTSAAARGSSSRPRTSRATLAHYYTYFDIPGVRFRAARREELRRIEPATRRASATRSSPSSSSRACRSRARRSRSRSTRSTRSSARRRRTSRTSR